jgi:glycosyltransferase involved in cell wall biosynthesis
LNPKVSICIPAFQQPTCLRRLVDSVLIQSFKDYEVIITDDSADNSVANLVHEYNRERAIINYHKNAVTKGSPENWNAAVELATGEYIKILHHDDYFSSKDSLTEFVRLLDENPNADFAFCSSLNCDEDQRLRFVHTASARQIHALRANPKALFGANFVGAPSATIYRSSVDQKFDARLKWLGDIDFYIRLLRMNRIFSVSMKPLVSVRAFSPAQVTASCEGNKRVEVFEWLLLYTKVADPYRLDYQCLRTMWRLFDRYAVRSEQDVVDCGVEFPIPLEIRAMLLLRRCSRYMPVRSWFRKVLLD